MSVLWRTYLAWLPNVVVGSRLMLAIEVTLIGLSHIGRHIIYLSLYQLCNSLKLSQPKPTPRTQKLPS